MKSRIIVLLITTIFAASGTFAQNTLKRFQKLPKGLSISITTPFEKMQQVKDAGFDWVEITMGALYKASNDERTAMLEQFRSKAERAGVKVWSVHLPFGRAWDISTTDEVLRAKVVNELSWFIDAVKVLNPKKLILHASAEPILHSVRTARMANCVRSINELVPSAKAIHAQLLIEDLPRTCLGNTALEMKTILSQVDSSVGVCFDTNHLLKESPESFADAMGKRIASLHVSDYDNVDERHWLMGRGVIDWNALITALTKNGYKGVFMFEVGGYKSYSEIVDSYNEVAKSLSKKK